MKRAVELNTHFTIPKKTRTDAEPDLYSQVISDDQHNDYIAPIRYGIANTKTFNQHPSNQDMSQSGSSTSAAVLDFNNLTSYNSLASGHYAVPHFAPLNTTYNLPKEVPKLSNTYKSTPPPHTSDPSMPKVLTLQFQPLYCKLCDHQLSSNAMAKLHYESKKHNKKVRQFLIEYAEETGEPLHPKASQLLSKNKTMLDKDPRNFHCTVCDLPLTGRLHAESHYMGKNHRRVIAGNAPVGKGHFDSTTGKWVRDLAPKTIPSDRDTFGLDFVVAPTPAPVTVAPVVFPMIPIKKDLKVEDLRCELCDVAVTSEEQLMLHLNGQKHRKRLNQSVGRQIIHTHIGSAVVPTFPDDPFANIDLSVYRTPTGSYYCEPCNTTVNSEIPFKQHLSSKKHKKGLTNRVPRLIKDSLPSTTTKSEEKAIFCNVCNVSMTSELQLTIHVNGQKHRKMCEEKGLVDDLQGNGILSNEPDNQQYYKYRTPSGLYYCKRCDLTLNTEAQFKAHITGKKHWSKVSLVAPATTLSK